MNKKSYNNSLKLQKIGKKKFGDIEIQRKKFHLHKVPFSIKNVNIDKIVVSNKVSCDKKEFKYFTGYKDAKKTDHYLYFSQK